MSGAKTGAKILMVFGMISASFSGWTHTTAVPVTAISFLTFSLAALAIIIGGVGYTKGEDSLGALIVGGIITIYCAGYIIYSLTTPGSQPFWIQFIAFEIGAIIFLCY